MNALLQFVDFKKLNKWSVHLLLDNDLIFTNQYPIVHFKDFTKKAVIEKVQIKDNKIYRILGVRSYGLGVYLNREVLGSTLKMKTYQQTKKDHLFWCKVDTKNGAFGIVTNNLKDGLGSSNMTIAELNTDKINTNYLQLFFKSKKFNKYMDNLVVGTTNRKYIKFSDLLNDVKIPLPSLEVQKKIVQDYQDKLNLAIFQEKEAEQKEKEIEDYLYKVLDIESLKDTSQNILNFTNYKLLSSWSYRDVVGAIKIKSNSYESIRLKKNSIAYIDVFRGKSPKYDDKAKNYILNQKCIRWNDIELEHQKKVNDDWYSNINSKFFTKKGDILINSTGDGTIGRSTIITDKFQGLIYDSHILLLRVNPEIINSLFLVYFINSALGQKQIENIKSAIATKQTELGINNLKNLQFILPDINIQTKIAEYILTLNNKIIELKKQSIKNKTLALQEFEKEIFNEA